MSLSGPLATGRLLELLPAAVYTCDPDGALTSFNRRAVELWGREPACGDPTARYCGSLRLFHLDGRPLPHDQTPMACVLETRRPFRDGRVVVERPDGTRVVVHADIDPIFAEDGTFLGAVNALHDITARHQAEAALRENERQLRIVLDRTPALLARCGRDRRFRFVNQAYAARLGLTPDDVIGRGVAEVLGEQAYEAIRPYVDRVLSGEDFEFEIDVPYDRIGPRFMRCSYVAERDGTGQVVGWVTVVTDETARHREEQRLRMQGLVLEHMAEGVSLSDEHGTILYTNPAEDRMFGYEPGELIGKPVTFLNAYPPEENARVVAGVMERLRTAGTWSGEFRNRRKDGTTFTTHARISRLELDGRPSWVCVQEDVTARKEAAGEQQKLTRVVENSPDFIGVASLDERAVFLNPAGLRLVGLPLDADVTRTRVLDYIVPDERERVRREILPLVLETGHWDGEVRFRNFATEEAIPVSWNVFTIPDVETGRPAFLACVSRDLREQKRAEELRKTITDNATAALFMTDPEGRCTFMNHAAEAMTGFTFRELQGRVLHDVIHARRPDGTPSPFSERPMDRALVERTPVRQREEVFFRRDATPFPVMCTASPIVIDGAPLGTLVEARDITEEKRAQQALREADQRKDEFLATLAHELRNPLAPTLNAVQLLSLAEDDPAVLRQARDTLGRQVRQMARMVDDLLDISRITRGKIELQLEVVDLGTVITSALETSRPMMEAAGHRLTVSLPPEPVRLRADATRLSQVVANLLNNAARYMDPGGRATLSAAREGDTVVIRVQDEGIGMSPETLPRIFDVFFQGQRGERSQGGLGIGLTLVKNLVALHGGTVTAHSDGPGRGSELVVRLPVHLDWPRERSPSRAAAATATRPARRILVVDDNVDAADTLAELLSLRGDEVRVAHDGPTALEAARRARPEVMLLDIGMPGMSGLDVARALKADPELSGIVLVAMTGWGQPEDRRRSREAGFEHHLVKPIELARVDAVLASLAVPERGARRPEAPGASQS